jgi:hypothetical protein
LQPLLLMTSAGATAGTPKAKFEGTADYVATADLKVAVNAAVMPG